MATRRELKKFEKLAKALADVGLSGSVAPPPEVRHETPAAAAEAFLAATETGISAHTARGRQRVARAFARWAQEDRHAASMAAIAQQEAEAWVDWRTGQVKATSLNTEISHVQALLTWCWRQRLMPDRIDLHDARPKHATNGRSAPLLTREVRAILGKFTDPDRLAVELLAATGLRVGELVGLPPSAWRPETGILHLEGVSATKNHERDLPIGRRMAQRLTDHLAGLQEPAGAFWQPSWTADRLAKRLRRTAAINPHRLRKHFYTFLTYRNCPTPVADYLMGHTLRAVDAAYLDHHEAEVERDWLQRLEDALFAE